MEKMKLCFLRESLMLLLAAGMGRDAPPCVLESALTYTAAIGFRFSRPAEARASRSERGDVAAQSSEHRRTTFVLFFLRVCAPAPAERA